MSQRLLYFLLFSLLFTSCTSYQGVGRLKGGFQNKVYPGRPIPRGDGEFTLDWPVDLARLTQKFNLHKARPHWGLDLAANRGTPILAAHEGTVIYVGNGFSGYGNLVIIEYDDRWATFYSHLDSTFVREGNYVQQGQRIASMGDTGRATGVHLHFELRYQERPLDPLKYLP